MIDKEWILKIESIKDICAGAGLPVDVEKDTTVTGIDGELILGDIPLIGDGDIFKVELNVEIRYSASKDQWKQLIKKLMLLSQKLTNRQRHIFNGFIKVDDPSNIVYNGQIMIPGRMNSDV